MSSRKRRSDTVIVKSRSNDNDSTAQSSAAAAASMDTAAATTPAAAHTTRRPKLKVRISRFHGVAHWTWNANDDVCGICQTAFEGVAPGCKYPDDCPAAWGRCAHAFHLQCVNRWLEQPNSKNQCPLCRQEWEYGTNPVNNSTNNNNNPGSTGTTSSD